MNQDDIDKYLDEAAGMYWSEYATMTYGKPVKFWEAVQLEHERWEGCRNPKCDLHKNTN